MSPCLSPALSLPPLSLFFHCLCVFCLSLLLSPSTFSLPLSSFLLFFSWSLLFFLASLALFFIIIIITHHHQCCFSILLSMTFTFDALFDSNLAVATLAQAISFSNVRKDFLRHELSWLCLVHLSTNMFCVFPSPRKPVPDSPVPTSSTNVDPPDGSVPDFHGIGARSSSTVDEQFYDILTRFAQLDSHLAQPRVSRSGCPKSMRTSTTHCVASRRNSLRWNNFQHRRCPYVRHRNRSCFCFTCLCIPNRIFVAYTWTRWFHSNQVT